LKLKEIGGKSYQRWIMWFNLRIRKKPYQPMYVYYCFLNITRDIAMFLIFALNKLASFIQVLHGCLKFVLWNVRFISLTDATHALNFCV